MCLSSLKIRITHLTSFGGFKIFIQFFINTLPINQANHIIKLAFLDLFSVSPQQKWSPLPLVLSNGARPKFKFTHDVIKTLLLMCKYAYIVTSIAWSSEIESVESREFSTSSLTIVYSDFPG